MLRWSIGLVLGTQAALLLLRPAGHGLPAAAVAALASLEVIAAALLLAPRTVLPGAVLLLAALVWAAALHLFLGEPPPATYLVCAAGLWAVLPERKIKTGPLDDAELFARFEDASLPNQEFRHREHLRVAWLHLRRAGDLARAALRFRRSLKRFAAAHGRPQLFHETLTWAYLALINERMQRGDFATSEEFLAANPDLLSHRDGLLSRYYDVEAITAAKLAREVFVLPARDGR